MSEQVNNELWNCIEYSHCFDPNSFVINIQNVFFIILQAKDVRIKQEASERKNFKWYFTYLAYKIEK